MTTSISLEAYIHGTLEELTGWNFWAAREDPRIMENVNDKLFEKIRRRYESFREVLLSGFGKKRSLIKNCYLNIGRHFVANSTDSVIEKFAHVDDKFEAEFNFRMGYDDDTTLYHFEVEDNGMGIDPQIEPLLFSSRVPSSKKTDDRMLGGFGGALSDAWKAIAFRGGQINYRNKGHMQGAVFEYSVPLKRLLI